MRKGRLQHLTAIERTAYAHKMAASKLGIAESQYKKYHNNGLRHCTYCKQWLPIDHFFLKKHSDTSAEKAKTYSACKSCMKSYVEETPKGRYSTYKCKARRRNISFLLTFEEFQTFWQKPCSYCGVDVATIGLDRVNNDQGYTANNCVACCSVCNMMKHSHGHDAWLSHIAAIIKHHQNKSILAEPIRTRGNGYWKH